LRCATGGAHAGLDMGPCLGAAHSSHPKALAGSLCEVR